LLALMAGFAVPARAHEVRPGYLELTQTDVETYDVVFKVPAAGARRLGLHVRFPEQTVETRERIGRFFERSYVERWSIRHPGGLLDETVHIDGLRRTMTDVLVRVERLDGTTLVTRIDPAQPELTLVRAPGLAAIGGAYLILGIEHILLGIDHLLFVLALVLLVKGARRLVATITAFTVAHSLTLAGATLGWVDVSIGPVEAIIALSIVFVAAEIVHGARGREGLTARAPWIVAFTFGLLHGFGFAGALHEVGLPERAIPLALFLFNVGVELGQLVFVGAILALAALWRRTAAEPQPWARLLPAYGIGAVAAYWAIERTLGLGA
jgi:hydrogenase/urease accessory protein HupE